MKGKSKRESKEFLGKPLREWVYFALICIVPFIIAGVIVYSKYSSLMKNGIITIGKTHEIIYAGYSSRYITYSYSINDEIFNDRVSDWDESIIVPNGVYYVVCDTTKSNLSIMLFDIAVDVESEFGEIIEDDILEIKSEISFWNIN